MKRRNNYGTKFKGFFKNGLRHGKCIEESKEGVRFEGTYKEDKRDGAYTERDKDGNIIRQGFYKNGYLESK